MKLLVTGATGFIGKHLVRRLVRDGHQVAALVRDPAKTEGLPAGIEWIQGDLSIFANPATVLPACDVVVHLAGIVVANEVSEYAAVNFEAVKDLAVCLERQTWRPRRLLFASSLAAAGPSATGAPKTEADPCEPIEAYGRSKRDAEEFLRTLAIPTTSFRPAVVFGEGDPATITLFRLAKRGLGFRAAGAAAGISFIDVDDLVDALVVLAADRSPEHHTYFVSHPHQIDQRELWHTLGTVMHRRLVVIPIPRAALYAAMLAMTALAKRFGFKNQLDVKQYEQITAPPFMCSSAALQRDHDWHPVHDLPAALARAADGFQKAGWL
ncbi:MAG: NAD-dependent epimerase/dehydratase family protein, partial [Kofleriaceae bacterium]